MKLNIICCVANDSIIGVNNDLYVKIKDDLKYFQKITSENYYKGKQNVLIMGYNTFKSLPGNKTINPLKNAMPLTEPPKFYSQSPPK